MVTKRCRACQDVHGLEAGDHGGQAVLFCQEAVGLHADDADDVAGQEEGLEP
jgi:hypothetical protein